MASRNNLSGSYKNMPKPMSLELPEPKTRRGDTAPRPFLPSYEGDGYGGGAARYSASDFYEDDIRDDQSMLVYMPGTNEPRSNGSRRPDTDKPRSNGSRKPRHPEAAHVRRRRGGLSRNAPKAKRPERRRPGGIGAVILGLSLSMNPLYRQIAVVCIGLLTILMVGGILVSNAFADNAFEVLLDGEPVGYMELVNNLTSETFHSALIVDLQAARGVGVSVDQVVTIRPTRVPTRDIDSRESISSRIINHHFEYKFAAVAVYVTNELGVRTFEGYLRSRADVEEAKSFFTERYITNQTVEVKLDPEWEIVQVDLPADDTDFLTPVELSNKLHRMVQINVIYIVQPGDSLHTIARYHEVELGELFQLNDLNMGSTIHPGQGINIRLRRNFVSVITVEEEQRVEVMERELVEIYVKDLPPGHTRRVQDGSDGQHRVIIRRTLVNGVETDVKRITKDVIVPAVDMIIEIGE